MRERTCPLCGSGRAAPIFTKDATDYWACPDCRFRFAKNTMTNQRGISFNLVFYLPREYGNILIITTYLLIKGIESSLSKSFL